ncbi:MAG: ATP-binding cassette domain-containing protein [Lachnospiraceae bacterium]|nr:ATP-binding cassette domain-containing protein [Lachnospiraceae bacterium]
MIEIKNVSFTYAGSEHGKSLDNVSLIIPRGKVTVLCGRSGCGKTTMTRLINGLVPYFYKGEITGDILINGESVLEKSVQERSGMVGSVFQNPRSQFFNVDSTSELVFGCENMKFSREEMEKRLESTTSDFDIEGLVNKNLFKMSGGEKQKIACASVSMPGPDIYVLDEPTSNLDLLSIRELAGIIAKWKAEGKTIIVADHRLNYLKNVADKVVLVEHGRVVWEKDAEEFFEMADKEAHSYGLRSLDISVTTSDETVKKEQRNRSLFTVNNLDFTYEDGNGVHVKNLVLPMGSIIGIVGENGAGKSTFVRCLCGLQKSSGSFYMDNKRLSSKELLKESYLVMQDVNHQLFTESVDEEIRISIPKEKKAVQDEILRSLLNAMDLTEYGKLHPMSLSGGQKQRVAVATALASDKRMLFFDEPTSGLDYEHMKAFSESLKEVRSTGTTPVVITHDLELLADSCDYLILLSEGEVKWCGKCDDDTLNRIEEHFEIRSFRSNMNKEAKMKKQKSPIARVWELGESGHKQIVISIVLALLGVFAGIVPFVMASKVITLLIAGEKELSGYVPYIVVGVTGYLLNTFLYTGALGISHKATFRILKEIREKVLAKLPKLPLGTIMEMKTGRLKQTIVDQVESMETTLAHVFPEIVSNIGGFLVVWIYMFVIDWRLALLAMIPLPVGMAFMFASMKGYGDNYAKSVEITTNMNESLIEYTGGIEVIKAYNQGNESYATLKERCMANASFFYDWMNRSKTNIYAMIIAPATMLTVLPFGWLFYQNGSLSFEEFLVMVILSLCVTGSLLAVLDFVDTLAKLGTVVGNVDAILSAKEQEHITEDSGRDIGNDIDLKDVGFAYTEGQEEVLKGVSLHIPQGSKTALVGPSGSGKSTIAKLIAGFWDVDTGSINFGETGTMDISLTQLYDRISYVSQENFLFDDTIMENIRMGNLNASDEEVIECAKASGCDMFIRNLENGYQTRVGGGGAHLSGGERQRIAIARAMLKDAPVVILDEATAYIDPENEAVIQEAVGKLVKGKTLIVIAHRLSTITDSDQIVLVNDGKIKATGKHDELLKSSPLYKSMWEAYVGVKEGQVA